MRLVIILLLILIVQIAQFALLLKLGILEPVELNKVYAFPINFCARFTAYLIQFLLCLTRFNTRTISLFLEEFSGMSLFLSFHFVII